MEELVEIIDEKTGKFTGKVITKSEGHKTGAWHGSIHILIVNKKHTKTLLQKRCNEKNFYPNTWDIAVGGHISAGEVSTESAKRELEEELGINSNNYKLEKIGIFKEKLVNNNIISNEFVHTFIIYTDIKISQLKLQKEEVSDAKWVNKRELKELITEEKIIPHQEEYKILNRILK